MSACALIWTAIPSRVFYINFVHQRKQILLLPFYLDQCQHFVLDYRGRVVFRRDYFNQDTIDEVPTCDKRMETVAAVFYARFQDLGRENKVEVRQTSN